MFDLLLFNTTGGEQRQRSPVAGAERQERPDGRPSRLSPTGCSEAQQEVLTSASAAVYSVFLPLISLLSKTKRKKGEKNALLKLYYAAAICKHAKGHLYACLPRHCDK